MSPTVTTTKPTINVSGLNDKLELIKKEVPYDFTAASSMDVAISRIGDESKILDALNVYLEDLAKIEARKSVGVEIRKSDALALAVPFRQMKRFAGIADRKEQTAAIFAYFASQPALIAELKTQALSGGSEVETED